MEPPAMPNERRDHLKAFLQQRDFCVDAGASITGLIVEASGNAVDRKTEVGRLVIDWSGNPSVDAVPLRMVGGLRALELAGVDPGLSPLFSGHVRDLTSATTIVAETLRKHDLELLRWFEQPPQTNEIGRSAGLMAGLLTLAKPGALTSFEVLEIGSSAGLNLLLDQLGFDFGGTLIGPRDAPLLLRPQWRGTPPPTSQIGFPSRPRGVDLNPLDIRDEAAVKRLRAYVWVDATHRLSRLDAGIALARQLGVSLEQGHAAQWLESRLKEPHAPHTCRVLMHSAVWKYLETEQQTRITSAMNRVGARATAERSLAWVSMEPEASTASTWISVQHWPEHPEPRRIARVDLHGDWIELL